MNTQVVKVEDRSIIGSSMTVCVAAIADGGKKLVLAADNMLTMGIGGSIQYQSENVDHKKVVKLNDNVYALFAGALHVMSPLVNFAKDNIKNNTPPLKVAEKIREELQRFALQKIEEEILKPAGLSWDIYRNKQKDLNPEIVQDMHRRITSFGLDVNIIIAGYDAQAQQPYIAEVSGSGVLIDRTLEGFYTNGSGGQLARFSLILSNYSQSADLPRVETLVKKAVADAQRAPGVGTLGDFIVIPLEREAQGSNQ